MANSKELPLHALVTSPKLIVADEPTGSLDTETAPWILHTLVNVNPQGATNVLATWRVETADQTRARRGPTASLDALLTRA